MTRNCQRIECLIMPFPMCKTVSVVQHNLRHNLGGFTRKEWLVSWLCVRYTETNTLNDYLYKRVSSSISQKMDCNPGC